MKKQVVLISSMLLAAGAGCADKTETNGVQPNILFLVIEDTSPYLFPAYGNQSIQTPHLDRLADNDWHRNGHIVPGQYFFPQYLREAGYFTVNAGKTDYNVTQSVQREWFPVAWDKMSAYGVGNNTNVSYNDEERGDKPFFAQFNNNTTHMSRIHSVYLHLREPSRLDPFGMNNLAHDPAYAHVVAELRKEASNHIRETKDLGFFPGDVRQYFVDQGISLFEWVRENPYPFDLLHEAAERASAADLDDMGFFIELLSHDRPEIRFWGASGMASLAHKDLLVMVPEELSQVTADEFSSVASIAAEAMVYAGETTKGLDVLAKLAKETSSYAISSLEQLGHRVRPVLPQIREIAKTSNNGVIRFAARSIMINFGEMPMVELFEPNRVEGFIRIQQIRVENWAATKP